MQNDVTAQHLSWTPGPQKPKALLLIFVWSGDKEKPQCCNFSPRTANFITYVDTCAKPGLDVYV